MNGKPDVAQKIHVHLRVKTKDAQGQALCSFLREAVPFYQAAPGIKVRLLRNRADPTRFIEVIEYASEDAYQKDDVRVRSDPKMLSFLAQWHSLLASKAEVEIYDDVTGAIFSED